MRGVTSQGSSAPNANNPSDPAIRRGANPTQPWRTNSLGGAAPSSTAVTLGGAGMGAAWADTTARATAPGTSQKLRAF